jgi:hypothetical protein
MTLPVRARAAVGGIVAFLITVWPVLLIGWAASTGSAGDLPAGSTLVVGLSCAALVGGIAGVSLGRALRRTDASRTLDAWGAYAAGLGVYVLALTVLPIALGALPADEGESVASRFWLLAALWVAGHVLAAALGVGAGAAVLSRGRKGSVAGPAGSAVPGAGSQGRRQPGAGTASGQG